VLRSSAKPPGWKEINLHLWMRGDRDPADARLAEMSGARFVFCGRLKE